MKSRYYDTRTILAFGITVTALLGITVLSVTVILSTNDDVNGRSQGVFNAVLPLFGTWVGTVLAYYFSRENFEAATGNTERLIRQLTPEERLRSIPVVDAMVTDIYSVTDLNQQVVETLEELENRNIQRLPILNQSGVLETLLFREGLKEYLLTIPQAERPTKILNNLLQEKPELMRTPTFVSERVTLAEARDAMEQAKNSKVVFVTQNGDEDEPVLGLLTSSDIAAHAKA